MESDIPDNVAFLQLDVILYSASLCSEFDICQAIYHYQGLKNIAHVATKNCNGNQIVFNITKKERNMDYSGLYSALLFVKCPAIKNISVKAVLYEGNTVELTVQYYCIPKVFLATHGKRKLIEPLSQTTSFNIYASPYKKPKSLSVKKGTYY